VLLSADLGHLSVQVLLPVFGRGHAHFFLERLAEIICLTVRQVIGNIDHRTVGIYQHILGRLNLPVSHIGDKINTHVLFKELAETVKYVSGDTDEDEAAAVFDRASEEVCRKFDVRCEADRYSIYASSLKPLKPREEAEDVELMEGKASDIPKLEPAPKSAKKKRAKAFEDLPDEPVRIDFDMLSDVDKKVYNAMRPHSPMIPDEIKVDGLRIQDVLASLTLLEISGAVEAGSGGYFVRCGSDDISFEDEDAAVPVE